MLSHAIERFASSARQCNRSVFGNLFAWKNKIMARLYRAQKVLSSGPNLFLVQLEQELISEYSKIVRQEKEYWALKSQLNWVAYGDCNTSFFPCLHTDKEA